ncbi:VCBS domain-containing protein [Roseateles sp.]|uniref:VCBS domain-containing protein n=1 Tax=Roseateles sp. TaxID=1971397 RepID=UPI003918B4A0
MPSAVGNQGQAASQRAATIAGVDAAQVQEDVGVNAAWLQASGTLSIADPDPGEEHFVAGRIAGRYGQLDLDASGHWTYSVENGRPEVQQLGRGQGLSETFSVSSADGSTHAITLHIVGSNDVPMLAAQSLTVREDGARLQGLMVASDVDAGDTQRFSTGAAVAGFMLNADGRYSFDPSNAAYQHLAVGQTQALSIPITVTDSAGASSTQSLTITLTGSNDGAIITGANTGDTTEDSTQAVSGQLTVSDVDDGEAHFLAQTGTAGTYGSFSLDENGQWHYTLDNSKPEVQALKNGEQVADGFTVSSADGSTHTVIVMLTGSNDAPVLQAQSQSVLEDGRALHGQMVASDVDAGDSQRFSLAHAVDGLTLNADGSYSFDPSHAAYQHLAAGQTQTLTIPITVTDSAGASSTAKLTITLTGSNDTATIGGVHIGSTLEDKPDAVTGQLTVTDVDDGQAHFVAQTGTAGSYGQFALDESGHWHYQLDNSKPEVQALKSGESVTDRFTVTSADGTTQQVTVTINGKDDGAVIAGTDTATVTEDQSATLHTSGQLTITDPDAGQAHFIAQNGVSGSYGQFSLDEAGHWTYSADSSLAAIQQLKAGASLTEQLTVSSADGTTHTITVTLQGTNDAPVLQAQSQAVSEDGATLRGQMVATDVDQGDSQTFSLAQAVDGFTLNADGSYSFDPSDAAYQHLAAGQTQTLTIPITVSDSAGASGTQNLTITLTGSNDGAIIGGVSAGSTREDSTQLTTGQLTVADVDDGEAHFIAQTSSAGQYGHFSLDENGQWSYQLDNSRPEVQALKSGDGVTDSFTVTSADGTSQHVSITITGKDDGAVIAGTDTGSVTEDQAATLSTSGQLTITDPDAGQASFAAQTNVAGSYGQFSIDAAGHWTYTADNSHANIQALTDGQKVTDSFTVMSADGTSETVTVTLTGTNDAAVISGFDHETITEDTNVEHGTKLATAGKLDVADVDTGEGDLLEQLGVTGTGGYGEFNITMGHWFYEVDNSHPAIQALGAGQTLTDSFDVTSADGTAKHTVTVTICGTNDAPILTAQTRSVSEDGPRLAGRMVATDVDTGDTQAFSTSAHIAGFTLKADGSYSFDPSHAAYQHLAAGQTQDLVIPVTVTDSAGATSTQNITLTLTGSNDGATIAGTDSGTVTEDSHLTSGKLSTSGTLTVTDPDAGQDHFNAQISNGHHGVFTLDAAGQWTYSADNSKPEIQQLKAGAKLTDRFTVTSADGTAHTVTVTVTGSNDAPVLQAQAQAITEDGALLTGKMVAADVDAGDTQAFSLAKAIDGFALNTDGSYSFDPSHVAYQHLAAGQTQDVVIPVTVTDTGGATSTQNLTITVTGSNDGATIAGISTGTTSEDSQQAVTGQLTVADVDDGQAHFVAQSGAAGSYGSFTLAEDGQWSYQLDNSKPEVQALKNGDSVNEHFTVTTVDGSSQQVTVTIAGQNDRAVIAGTDSGRLTEDQGTQGGFFLIAERLTVLDPDQGEAEFVPRARVLGHYGVFTLSAQGDWTYIADNSLDRIQHLKQGDTLTDSFVAHSVDGSAHTVTVTITGSNDAPVLTASSASPADLGTTLEDTPKHFSEADLLRLVGASDADGDALHITAIHVDAAYGSFAQERDGSWTFTPVANAHHRDVPLTLSVSDGQATTQAQATLDIKSVTDAAAPSLSVMAEQHVIQFGDAGAPAIYTTGGIQSGGDLGDFAIEMTVVGGSQVAVQGHNGPTLISYATAADMNAMYIWRPENLQLHLGGRDYDTGVDISHDTGSHRYGFVWNGAAGSFDVLRDGQIVKHLDNVAKGGSLTGGGVMAFGNDQDSLGGGFAPEDAWHGQLFSASMAKGVSAAAMTQHALRDLATGSNLIMDVQAQGRQVVDLTGHHSFATSGPVTTPTTQVDTRIANPNPGALLHLSAHVGAPADPDDHVSAVAIKGFSAGTELSDGQGHSYVIHGPADAADITHWNLAGLTAQLPAGSHVGAHVVLEVTTTGPDGHVTTTASGAQGVTLNDAGDPVTTEVSIQLDIAPTDSPALISGQDHGGVTEDAGVSAAGDLEARGRLSIQDPDPGQAVFVPQAGTPSNYGRFSIDAHGNWDYLADNQHPDVQALGQGETLTDLLQVSSPDGTQHTISITLQGTNDAPVLQAQSQSVLEDGRALHGQMLASDVDQGDTQSFSLAQAVDGFTLNADGSYSFDPSHASYQQLAQGQTQTLTIPITVTDSAGASSTEHLTITLTGTNDGATLGGDSTGSTSEDSARLTTGQLSISDADDGEAYFIAQTGSAGSYGQFTLDENGQWSYQLDNSKPELQALKGGDSVTDSFTVTSADGTSQQVTVTITGKDDGAVIAGADTGTVTEDQAATLSTGGQLTITDADAGQAHFIAQTSAAGSYGQFSLDDTGHWNYSADNSQAALQQLKAGATLSDSFTATSADGSTHTVTVTLTGTNDAPVLQAQSQSVLEDGSALHGQMVATDVDQGDTQTFSLAQAVDGFTLNADGSYSFDPANAAYQQLAAGQTQDLVIPVTVTDSAGASHTQNLTITITGTNDGAVIGGVFTGAVTEDQAVQSGQLQASGQLSITDADSGENHFIPQTDVLGSYGLGRFSLDAQGHWSYSADNSQKAIQQLAAGATLNDSFTVQGADGAQHTVTVTLTGTNDAPQFHLQVAPDYHPELESNDVLPLIISNIGFTRVAQYLDIQQILQGQAPIGAYANTCVTVSLGGLALIGPDGQAAQVFAPGQEFKLQTLVDWQQQGPGHEFRVFGPKGTTGLDLSFHDAGDPNHITGPQGQASLYVNQVNIWPPFHAWQASASTSTASDSGLLTATEGAAPLSGQFHASDIDVGDTLSYSLGQPVDGFTLNADGSYSFDPAHPSYQHLAAGQSETLSIPITVTDSAGASSTQTLSILLRGANDAASFGGVETGATQEDRPDTLSGQLTVADADDGEAHFIAQSGTAGSYGQFSLDENGQWHYQIDNSKPEVQALRDGQNVTDSFTVRSADGTAHMVNISIAGKNDAALITGEDHQTLTEDQNVSGGQLIAHGQLHASTPDAGGDQFTPLADLAGKFGHLSLSADGSWVYKAENSSAAVQALHAGQSATESFTVHSVDGTAHTLSLSIQGADEPRHDIWSSIVSTIKSNWAPYNLIGHAIDAGDVGALGSMRLAFNSGNPSVVDANGHVLASGSSLGAFGHDISMGQVVDLLKSHPGARLVLDGNVGGSSGFYLHDSGNVMELHFRGLSHYNQANNPMGQLPIDGLPTPLSAAGTVPDVSDSLTISVTDISVDHADQLQTSGQLSISDADAGENHFNAQKDVAGTYGSFSIDASGHWVYSVDNGQAAVQNLQAGAQLSDSFMVTSADGSSHVVSVAVYGKNDAPVLFAQSQSVSEDGAQLSGQMHASDADAGDTLSFRIDQPVAGFTLNADGSYRFDPSNAAYQHLAEGQTETLVIPVFVTDRMGASSVQDLSITLTGKNDATVIAGDDQRTVTEDQDVDGYGNLHVTGQLHADDPDGTAGPLQFQQQNAVQASYGRFTLNADGYWLYEADNKNPAIQQLKTGESLTDTLTAHSADGTPHTITVTIQGQDDAAAFVPQVQGAKVSSADIYTMVGVQLMSSEHRELQFVADVLLGNLDPRSYATAEMSFTNAGVALRAPDGRLTTVYHAEGGMTTVPLMELRNWHNQGQGYDVVLVDATGMPVNVFPHDAGDPDKLSGFNQYVSGFSGPFNAAAVLYPDASAAIAPTAGSLSAAHVDLPFDIAHVQEDSDQQIMGLIQVQDPDEGQSSMQAMTNHQTAHGSFNIDVNGNWTYQLDSSRPDVQALKDGETLIDTITVHSADGTPHEVNITIHGQADGAVISGTDNDRVIEDQQVTAAGRIETQGQLSLADADAGEAVFVAQANAAGSYGTFSLDEDGHWHYSADNGQAAIQQLNAGATLSDSFTVHSADGMAHTVSVTITGSNDAPVLTAQSQALDGGGALYQGHMSATDADVGDALSFSTTATVAGFTLHADGSYQFDPSVATYQHLASGQSQKVVIPITVTDSAGATSTQNLTFTVTPAAHGAVISGVDSGSVVEDAAQNVASGQLSIVDPDAGEAHFIAQADVPAQHGHFSLQDNGAWTYTLDNKDTAVQALKAGENFSEHLTVKSVDGSTHVLTVTVQGSNDAPVLQAQSQSVTEDGSLLRGQMAAQDVDHGDALHFSTPNAVGGFTLNADGSYSFDPSHHDYQSLTAGQVRDIDIPITVTDSTGATATQMLSVHITGRDDSTFIYGVDSGSVQAGVHPETSGDLHASDADAGQSGFRAGTVNGSFGSLSIDAQGHWTYRVDGNDSFVMHLLPNSHITEQVTVHSVDGTAHDIELEVSGPPLAAAPPYTGGAEVHHALEVGESSASQGGLAAYLHFAESAQDSGVSANSHSVSEASPLGGYLGAAGVEAPQAPDDGHLGQPSGEAPFELGLEPAHGSGPEITTADDAAHIAAADTQDAWFQHDPQHPAV